MFIDNDSNTVIKIFVIVSFFIFHPKMARSRCDMVRENNTSKHPFCCRYIQYFINTIIMSRMDIECALAFQTILTHFRNAPTNHHHISTLGILLRFQLHVIHLLPSFFLYLVNRHCRCVGRYHTHSIRDV